MNKIIKTTNKVLLREFIYDRLYYPQQGYFCKKDLQVGQMKQPLDFNKFIGYQDYLKSLSDGYPKNAWLTPSQIFKPYYGMTVANYIMQAHQRYEKKQGKSKSIQIVQVGAGLGSAAEAILYFFKNYESRLYQNLTYTIVEISSELCKRMKNKLIKDNQRHFQSGKIRIINEDILNYRQEGLSYILFFQVLDNLPHDRVVMSKDKTHVSIDTKEQSLYPISDKYIKQALQYYLKTPNLIQDKKNFADRIANFIVKKIFQQKSDNKKQVLFLPTYFLKFLTKINKNIPNAHLVISDFDLLYSSINGINAPIVSLKGQLSHHKKDYDTYLVDRGAADIFFPTNFALLKTMYEQVTKKKGIFLKSHQFISEFSRQNWAQTQSGFNPIKEDFYNTSFFLTNV